jgi:hypothetical protein
MSMSEKKKLNISSSSKPYNLCLKIVFSNWPYIIFATITAIIFWIVSSIFDQLLFFSPIVIFYLPDDAVLGFILADITAILLGIVVSMNIYVFRHSKLKIKRVSLFSGSSLSIVGGIERQFEAEQLLVATGRKPNTPSLHLENTTVRVRQNDGVIIVNSEMNTSASNIWVKVFTNDRIALYLINK